MGKKFFILTLFIFIITIVAQDNSYNTEIQKWRQKRLTSLKKNWLSLIGLHWLKPGSNTFGANNLNDISLPKDKAPAIMGVFTLKEGEVYFHAQPGVKVYCKDKLITVAKVFDGKNEGKIILTHKSLSWFVIKRGNRIGLRIRDAKSSQIENFKTITTYPLDSNWRVEAIFKPYNPPKKLSILNVLKMSSQSNCPGALEFVVQGKSCKLDVMDSGNVFFVMFSDSTTGNETYSVGRYVYVDKPKSGNKTTIDFNKAYNPPCAYTYFATCPLPPRQNNLPVKITAGEKYTAKDGH